MQFQTQISNGWRYFEVEYWHKKTIWRFPCQKNTLFQVTLYCCWSGNTFKCSLVSEKCQQIQQQPLQVRYLFKVSNICNVHPQSVSISMGKPIKSAFNCWVNNVDKSIKVKLPWLCDVHMMNFEKFISY